METVTRSSNVTLSPTVITANAADALHPADVLDALRRHARGDWGEVCAADAAENERSITEGCRLRSAYTDRNGVEFWVITEWDRSVTTVSLPEY